MHPRPPASTAATQMEPGALPGADGRGPVAMPGRTIALLGLGHAVWGILAYRREIADLAKQPVDGVGDGLFNKRHADDGRATAFWFMFAAPMVWLCGRLSEAALQAGDHKSAAAAGRTVMGLGAIGSVIIPRSGFPAAIPAGWLLLRRAGQVRDAASDLGAAPRRRR